MNADTLVPPRALLYLDGSADAVAAIVVAGELLDSRSAAVVTVWEPVAIWAPYDPATALTAGSRGWPQRSSG
jgi:hypothetical protein